MNHYISGERRAQIGRHHALRIIQANIQPGPIELERQKVRGELHERNIEVECAIRNEDWTTVGHRARAVAECARKLLILAEGKLP